MSVYRINALALAISISLFGCLFRANENYCEGRNKHNNCSEPPWDAGVPDTSCLDDTTCMAPRGVCKVDTGTCVQCTDDNRVACKGTTPICGADFTCRGCTTHSDCGWISSVCRPDGACAAESEVAYVEPGGVGTLCMKGLPCTLQAALGTNRPYIKVMGTITENVTVNVANAITILAEPGASLSKDSGILLRVEGGSKLTVYDLTLTGTKGGADAISMQNGNTATVTLHRVKIVKNTGAGIKADGGTLNVFQSTIAENAGGGINMVGATAFDIRNNFVVRNGTDNSDVGGVQANPQSNSRLEFNTIVGNRVRSGIARTGGVFCDQTGISVSYNLIFGNAEPQTIGGCTFDLSLRAAPAGVGFENIANNDYHLTGGPDVIDKITCSSIRDIDDEGRPRNGKCDYGADEF